MAAPRQQHPQPQALHVLSPEGLLQIIFLALFVGACDAAFDQGFLDRPVLYTSRSAGAHLEAGEIDAVLREISATTWYKGEFYRAPIRIQCAPEVRSGRASATNVTLSSAFFHEQRGVVEVGYSKEMGQGIIPETSTSDEPVVLRLDDVEGVMADAVLRWVPYGDHRDSFTGGETSQTAAGKNLKLRIRLPTLTRSMWRRGLARAAGRSGNFGSYYDGGQDEDQKSAAAAWSDVPDAHLEVNFRVRSKMGASQQLSHQKPTPNPFLVESLRLVYLAARRGMGEGGSPRNINELRQAAVVRSVYLHRDLRVSDRTLLYIGAADYDELFLDRTHILSRYRNTVLFEADPVTHAELEQNLKRGNALYGTNACANARIVNEKEDGFVDFQVNDWQAIEVVQKKFGWNFRMGSLLKTKMPDKPWEVDGEVMEMETETSSGSGEASFDAAYNATVMKLPTTTLSTVMRGVANSRELHSDQEGLSSCPDIVAMAGVSAPGVGAASSTTSSSGSARSAGSTPPPQAAEAHHAAAAQKWLSRLLTKEELARAAQPPIRIFHGNRNPNPQTVTAVSQTVATAASSSPSFDLVIDVQGAELSVLSGISGQAGDWRKIGNIGIEITVLEYASFPTYIGGSKFPDVDNLLTSNGFVLQPTWDADPTGVEGWNYQAAEVVTCNRVQDVAAALMKSRAHLRSFGLRKHRHGEDHREPVFPPDLDEPQRKAATAIQEIWDEAQRETAVLSGNIESVLKMGEGEGEQGFVARRIFDDGFLTDADASLHKEERGVDVDVVVPRFALVRTLARRLGKVLRRLSEALQFEFFVRPDVYALIKAWGLQEELREDVVDWAEPEEEQGGAPIDRIRKDQEAAEAAKAEREKRENMRKNKAAGAADGGDGGGPFDTVAASEAVVAELAGAGREGEVGEPPQRTKTRLKNEQTVKATFALLKDFADARYLCRKAWIPAHGDTEYSSLHLLHVGRHFVVDF
eukprot:g616.t1